jgi:glucose-1-phosphate adenylyltransferase
VADSILFDRVRVGPNARVQKAILDKEVVIEPGATIGINPQADVARGFTVTESGITIVGKGVHVA